MENERNLIIISLLSHQGILQRHIYILFSSTYQLTPSRLISSEFFTSLTSYIHLGMSMKLGAIDYQ